MGKLTCWALMSRILRRLWTLSGPGSLHLRKATPIFILVLSRDLILSFYLLLVLHSASVCLYYAQFLANKACAFLIYSFILLYSTLVSAPKAHSAGQREAARARYAHSSNDCHPGSHALCLWLVVSHQFLANQFRSTRSAKEDWGFCFFFQIFLTSSSLQ